MPLDPDKIKALDDLYYKQNFIVGIQKLYHKINELHPELKITNREVREYLKSQSINQEFQRPKQIKTFSPVTASKPFALLELDLIDQSGAQSNNFHYILNIIDIYTRHIWAYPLKDKSAESTTEAFQTFLDDIKPNTPKIIQTDKGKEFLNQEFKELLKSNNIKHRISITPSSNGIVERANQTLRNTLFKSVYLQNKDQANYKGWDKYLDKTVNNYNDSFHTAINTTPNNLLNLTPTEIKEHNKNNDDPRVKKALSNVSTVKLIKNYTQNLELNDLVRKEIPKKTELSKKMYKPSFSSEIYKIYDIQKANNMDNVKRYYIKELDTGKKIDTPFYNQQLLKIPNDTNQSKKPTVEKDKPKTREVRKKKVIFDNSPVPKKSK